MTYKHLSQAERHQIYVFMEAGHDQSQLAKLLDRHKSSISRELSRNIGFRKYRPKQACEIAAERSQHISNTYTVAPLVKEQPNALLRLQCSPEQGASKLTVSHETPFKHVYADKTLGGDLWKNPRCHKQKRKRYASWRNRSGQIPNRRLPSERPVHIECCK